MEGKLNIEIRKSSMEIARDLIKSHIKQPTLEQEIEYSKYIEKYIQGLFLGQGPFGGHKYNFNVAISVH